MGAKTYSHTEYFDAFEKFMQTGNREELASYLGDMFLTLPEVQEMIAQGIDLAELPLSLVDSSRIIELEFDIFELWGQLRFGDAEANQQQIALNAEKNAVIFWQMDLQVQAKPLSDMEAVFMTALKQTANFESATTQALAKDESFEVSALFAELLTAQLLTAKPLKH